MIIPWRVAQFDLYFSKLVETTLSPRIMEVEIALNERKPLLEIHLVSTSMIQSVPLLLRSIFHASRSSEAWNLSEVQVN